eukprot:TRINITY_DN939_c0_g1_i1.p1 TRINITY_DN939_c0_g1~~TRINITY_DN939_c0_g1_i1.p1  ORF type:complete len:215 (+),score=83.55 TRINITY_DN939_c0_g1_i1:30-647(+)
MADYNALVDETLTAVKGFMSSEDGWAPVEGIPSSVTNSFIRDVPGAAVKLVRATGNCSAAAQAVHDMLWNESVETKKKEDDTLLVHEVLEEFGDEMNIIHQVYKLPWPLANREIVVVKKVVRDEDGTIYHVNKSVTHDKCKEGSKIVRAQVSNCSYIFKPTGDGTCEVSYIVAFDPMGSIPKWLVNRNTSRVAERIAQVIAKAQQ